VLIADDTGSVKKGTKPALMAPGAGLAGQKLFDGDDDLAFGVPFAEAPPQLRTALRQIEQLIDTQLAKARPPATA